MSHLAGRLPQMTWIHTKEGKQKTAGWKRKQSLDKANQKTNKTDTPKQER